MPGKKGQNSINLTLMIAQLIACKGNKSMFGSPFMIMNTRIMGDIIGKKCLDFTRSDTAYFIATVGNSAMKTIKVIIAPGTGHQMET